MTDFWLLLAALVIGIPGAVFLVLQVTRIHRKQVLAYEWSAAEVVRRGQRLDELEKLTKDSKKKIGELMKENASLRAELAKHEQQAHTAKAEPATDSPPAEKPKVSDEKPFSVAIFNQEVRRATMMGEKHRSLADKWADLNYEEIYAASPELARKKMMLKYPPERGFVIESITPLKRAG